MQIKVENFTITLSAEVMHVLSRFVQRKPGMHESGGILLGRIISDNIEIEKISIPTELDKSTRTTFERHRLSAQIIINYEYANTYGQLAYLGEWHTHPEDFPTPSAFDVRMIKKQFAENKFITDFLILLIQGRKGLCVSVIMKNKVTSVPLKSGRFKN